jgi:hypothetical protein
MESTARGVLKALPAPRTLHFPLSLTLVFRCARHRRAGEEAGREVRPEHYPRRTRSSISVKHDGNALPRRRPMPSRCLRS